MMGLTMFSGAGSSGLDGRLSPTMSPMATGTPSHTAHWCLSAYDRRVVRGTSRSTPGNSGLVDIFDTSRLELGEKLLSSSSDSKIGRC